MYNVLKNSIKPNLLQRTAPLPAPTSTKETTTTWRRSATEVFRIYGNFLRSRLYPRLDTYY